jgi:hypothetical protein
MSRKLCVHVVERVVGNAKRSKKLPPGCLTLPAFFSIVPDPLRGGGQHCCKGNGSCETPPEQSMVSLLLSAPPGHQAPF